MSQPTDPDLFDEALTDADATDFPIDEWSLDEFDDSAELSSLRSAWMGSDGRFE